MKKILSAVAISALCATVASADVTSGVVGYQQVSIVNGYQFFTVTFKTIDESSFSLSDIICLQSDGTDWKDSGKSATKCTGDILVRKIASNGAYGTQYLYYGGDNKGWYEGSRASDLSNKVNAGDVTFSNGEGMIVYSGKSAAVFQISGKVSLTSIATPLSQGYAFGGNCTPVTINLSAITCTQSDGNEWKDSGKSATKCTGDILVRKISSNGAYGTEYLYYGGDNSGWYEGTRASDFSNKVTGNSVTFAPGEGFIVYCGKTAAILNIPSPL